MEEGVTDQEAGAIRAYCGDFVRKAQAMKNGCDPETYVSEFSLRLSFDTPTGRTSVALSRGERVLDPKTIHASYLANRAFCLAAVRKFAQKLLAEMVP